LNLQNKTKLWIAVIVLLTLAQTTASALLPRSFALTLWSDVTALLLMLCATLAFGTSIPDSTGRARVFWSLQVGGWGLLLCTQVLWMVYEVVLRREVPNPFVGDVLLFLSEVPVLAGLLLKPHAEAQSRKDSFGAVDFMLLLLWWLYLYLFFVIPWQYVSPNEALYGSSYNQLAIIQELVSVVVLGVLVSESSGRWRRFYGLFLGAQVVSSASDYVANRAIDYHIFYPGCWYELPYIFSLASFTVVAIAGFKLSGEKQSVSRNNHPFDVARLAMMAVLSLPVMAGWAYLDHSSPPAVTRFRILVTLGTMLLMALCVFVKQHRLGKALGEMNQVLEEASLTDPLTGVRNRRFFDATIESDVSQTLRSYQDGHDPRTRDLVFYLIDADDFKEVNDRYGHEAGDQILVEMARRISSAIRHSDVLVRWGGEEFLVVSRYTDRGEAATLAGRVLTAVGERPFILPRTGEALYKTCSIGWAAFPWLQQAAEGVGYQEVLSLADRGLYEAKQAGKNRAIGRVTQRASRLAAGADAVHGGPGRIGLSRYSTTHSRTRRTTDSGASASNSTRPSLY
jgi:diguanylate cyclase (GGDEF)-like protein